MAPITDAVPPDRTRDVRRQAAAIAFTWTGLQRMGLRETALASFSRPFREGMFQEDRLRRLGDRRERRMAGDGDRGRPALERQHPAARDAAGAADASAPTTSPIRRARGADRDAGDGPCRAAALHARRGRRGPMVRTRSKPHWSRTRSASSTACRWCSTSKAQRHQPRAFRLRRRAVAARTLSTRTARSRRRPPARSRTGAGRAARRVPDRLPQRPSREGARPGRAGRSQARRPAAAGLPPHPEAEGFFDLGLNGSYMVVRELKQDVAAFWNSMDANAARDPQAGSGTLGPCHRRLARRAGGRPRPRGPSALPRRPLAARQPGLPRQRFPVP